VTIAYLLKMTAFLMKRPAPSKETVMGKSFIQKKSKQQKNASSSVTQHVDAVGSPFILWFLRVSFLKTAQPSMSPVKIASLERGAALMKLYQAQLKSPQQLLKSPLQHLLQQQLLQQQPQQQLLKSPQQPLENLRVIANLISLKANLFKTLK
jgi:hypothetical protein